MGALQREKEQRNAYRDRHAGGDNIGFVGCTSAQFQKFVRPVFTFKLFALWLQLKQLRVLPGRPFIF